MYRSSICILFALLLTSCSFFSIHKQPIEQGNVITPDLVSQLHSGMTQDQVTDVMGTPMLVNLFTPNQVEYVYTYQSRNNPRIEKRVTLIFSKGRLRNIITT